MTQDRERAKGSLRGDQDQLMFGQGFSFSGYERDPLYLNLGNRKVLDISGCSGIDSVSDGRAAVFADFDNDGDLDVFMTTIQGQSHLLFRNNVGQDNRWLRVALEGGASLGKDAFSAVVRVRTSAGVLTKTKAGGNGYISQHDPRLLFGLGKDAQAESVEVTWPNGTVESFAGPFTAGTTVRLVQGSGRAEPLTLSAARLPDPLTRAQAIASELHVKVGQAVPDLKVVALDGKASSLRQLQKPGRRLLVNVWATWCVPCKKEMPELEAMRSRLAERGIDLVGVSVDTEKDAPVADYARARVSYPVYRIDPADMGRLYTSDEVTVPLSFLLEADGRVAELIPGWSDASRRRFEQILGSGDPAAGPLAQAPPPPPAPAAKAEETPAPAFKISGLVYGDYYDVALNHRDDLESQNGFWIRRLYFTYDHTLSKSLSLRVRLEANSKGDFKSTGVNTPYIKDAWLKWAFGAHALSFGLAPTPNIDFAESFQGYRSIEKTPLDLYRWDSSRDLGLLVQGGLGKERRTRYSFQLGNGSGTGSEVDQNKAVRGQLVHRFASGLVLEGYADWQDRPDAHDISTLEASAGWQAKRWRASLQYGWQERRQAGPLQEDLELELLSAFAMVQLTPKLAVVGRLDRNFDPIPNGETIDYMPFSDQAKSMFGYVAVDVTLAKTVHLIPNVEWTTYSDPLAGTTPGSDLVPRLTLFFSW